ncbi:MAG: GNAT family N-acetyltransferase [Gammaproteobacteria bacterium]
MSLAFKRKPPDLRKLVVDAERVSLRAISEDDTQEIYENFTAEITKYMMPAAPKDVSETRTFVDTAVANLDRGKELHFVIRRRKGGGFLGVCGLHGGPAEPELGIWLSKSAHGHRYGLEAVTALVEWTRHRLEFERLVYPVDRRNIASRKIPEALGGRIVGQRRVTSMSGIELDEVVYGLGDDR